MRNRQNDVVAASMSVKPDYVLFGNAVANASPITTPAFYERVEFIDDVVSPRFAEKPVDHYIRSCRPTTTRHEYKSGQSLVNYTRFSGNLSPRYDRMSTTWGTDWSCPNGGLSSLSSKVIPIITDSDYLHHGTLLLRNLLPGIRPAINSLVNSIIELKDFKSIGRNWSDVQALTRSLMGKRKMTLGQMARAIASGNLQYAFNLKPLASEIESVYNTVSSLNKQIKNLLDDAGTFQTRHGSADLRRLYTNLDDSTGSTNQGNYYFRTRRVVKYPIVKMHAKLKYRFTIPELVRSNLRLRGYLDYLGVNLNPQIIWNAIPYSFLVDWVVNVSSFLSNFRVANVQLLTDVSAFVVSVKIRRDIELYLKYNTVPDVHPTTSDIMCSEFSETRYQRRIHRIDEFMAPLRASGLNSSELSLLLSLIVSRK